MLYLDLGVSAGMVQAAAEAKRVHRRLEFRSIDGLSHEDLLKAVSECLQSAERRYGGAT